MVSFPPASSFSSLPSYEAEDAEKKVREFSSDRIYLVLCPLIGSTFCSVAPGDASCVASWLVGTWFTLDSHSFSVYFCMF